MTEEKPSRWADALLTLWIVTVGIIYFGGYFVPAIGALTGAGAAFYALMVLISALVIARRFLNRTAGEKRKKVHAEERRTKKGK